MKTLRLAIGSSQLGSAESRCVIDTAAQILRNGGTVALPTETVYGLGANALNETAVARIFAAKQRPAWDPVIVHIADESMLAQIAANIPSAALNLMKAFWPGPLTLLLPRSAAVPDSVTAGRPLVGVRMPAHPVTLELIRRAGVPIAAPSANTFGHTSPTTAQHVLDDLDGRIDAVLDAGPTTHGVESTVLDPTQSPMILYRPGAITAEQIRAIAGDVELFRSAAPLESTPKEALPSPGVGIRHYAPNARLILVEGVPENLALQMTEAIAGLHGETIGVMLPAGIGVPSQSATVVVRRWGRWAAPEEMARDLYAVLRELDSLGCSAIVCPLPLAEGIGAAIRDRLMKAARPQDTG